MGLYNLYKINILHSFLHDSKDNLTKEDHECASDEYQYLPTLWWISLFWWLLCQYLLRSFIVVCVASWNALLEVCFLRGYIESSHSSLVLLKPFTQLIFIWEINNKTLKELCIQWLINQYIKILNDEKNITSQGL